MLAEIQYKQGPKQNQSNLTFENYREKFQVSKAQYISPVFLWEKVVSCRPQKHEMSFQSHFYKVFQSQTKFLPTLLSGKKREKPHPRVQE